MSDFHDTLLRDIDPAEMTPIWYQLLGLDEAPWDELVATGMDPDTYVYGQCLDTVRGVEDAIPVYMGIGVDAPRARKDQAVTTPDIYSPNSTSMKLTNLDGGAAALEELGLK